MKKLFNKIKSLFRKKEIKYTSTMQLYYDDELLEQMNKHEIEDLIKKDMPFVKIEWIKIK